MQAIRFFATPLMATLQIHDVPDPLQACGGDARERRRQDRER
jgi:hypothetical protein